MRKSLSALAIVASFIVCSCGGGHSSGSLVPVGSRGANASNVRSESATSNAYATLVAASRPIAYYRLNDTNAVLVDGGTQHLDGAYGANVVRGGTALTADTGSASAVFPGSPAGANIAQNSATVPSIVPFAAAATALTVEAWILPKSLNTTGRFVPVVSYGREAQGQAWVLQVSPQSKLDFWMKTTGGKATSYEAKGVTSLAPGKAYQVVATYDGNNERIYVDGKIDVTIAASGSINYSGIGSQTGLAVGGALGSTEPIFAGSISDVSIYAAALSATTIDQHHTVGQVPSTATPAPIFTPNLQAYPALVAAGKPIAFYTLKDTATTMTDSSGHNLNGVYGANVRHGGTVLTSDADASSTFPGSPSGADVPANTGTVAANRAFYSATNVTVEAWVKPADFNRTAAIVPIVSYGRQSIGSVWSLQFTAQSRLAFSIKVKGGLGSYLVAAVPLSPLQVYQVAASYDGAAARLYINGSLAASTPATGALDYLGVPPQNALTVGGATGGNSPVFNGAMNDVSIYPTALTADVIENHYLTGRFVSVVTETPRDSDAFVDTIGVVTHLRNTGGPYRSFSTFESLLKASGIRHIGDALASDPSYYPAEINALAADGIHASLITNLTQTSQSILATLPAFSNAIDAVAGPNEPDDNGNPNWVPQTRSFVQMLWSTIKTNPATTNLSVIGPALTSAASDTALGDMSSYMDFGSMHDYFDGYNPGTAGWGSIHQPGVYGSISYNLNVVAIVSGNKPAIATETGYGDSTADSGGIDDRTLARYAPRIYLEHFLNGVARTTIYEFYDEPGTGNFHDFGLVQSNNVPKSSYYALQSLIGTLADQGGSFSTTPLTYVLTGNVNSLHHLLLQKRDGTYELVLWLETPSYDPNAKVDIAVPQQILTFKPASAPASATISTIGDLGTVQRAGLPFVAGAATIPVDDRVTIVSFK